MKKIISVLSFIVLFAPPIFAQSYTNISDGVVIGWRSSGIAPTTGQLGVQYPTFNPRINIIAPATASATAYGTISLATATLATPLLPATTTVTLALAGFTDMITPRNLVFLSTGTSNMGSSIVHGVASVIGVDMFGITRTETINFSTSSTTVGWTGIGNIGWSSVTSITISYSLATLATAASTIVVDIGSGTKLAIEAKLIASTEILKVLENNALVTTGTYNYTYNTYTPVSAPNGTQNYMLLICPNLR